MQCLLVGQWLATLLVVVSFLCGNWPIFQDTFVEKIHDFITFGVYGYFLRFVGIIFGSRGKNFIISIENWCCDRQNPTFQLLYLSILGVTYYIIGKSSFRYIPGYYVSELHWYASMVAVGVGVLLLILTSFSDPGTVTADNVSQYISVYPYDDIIYVEMECPTCKIPKPARSKHCGICDKCVARFDHHCGWMNNCIGEKNIRYFMAFLLWHFIICIYGAVILCLILAGQLEERKIIYLLTDFYGFEKSFSSLFPRIIQWLLASYKTQILLITFLAIISLLLAVFFGYHAQLCLTNTTTNENFKWQDYMRRKMRLNKAKVSSAALKAGISATRGEAKALESKCRSFFHKSPLQNGKVIVKNNLYDRGTLSNLWEIVVPPSQRQSFSQKKS